MYKRIQILVAIIFSQYFTQAQENGAIPKYWKVGFYYLENQKTPQVKLISLELFSEHPSPFPVLTGGSLNTFGLYGLYPINRKQTIELELGLDYTHMKASYEEGQAEAEARIRWDYNMLDYPNSVFRLIKAPVGLRFNFLKYFLYDIGASFNYKVGSARDHFDTVTKAGRVGFYTGIGLKYDFDFGISLFAEARLELHSVIYYGFRFGISYTIKPRKSKSL